MVWAICLLAQPFPRPMLSRYYFAYHKLLQWYVMTWRFRAKWLRVRRTCPNTQTR